MSPVWEEALAEAKERGHLGPLADLWISGHQLTAEERDGLRALRLRGGRKESTRREVHRRATIIVRYHELRAPRPQPKSNDAADIVAREFKTTAPWVLWLVRGGDQRAAKLAKSIREKL